MLRDGQALATLERRGETGPETRLSAEALLAEDRRTAPPTL